MSDPLNERLNRILPRVISDEFLSGSGIGNVWVNALRMILIPLVVSLLISVVGSVPDVRSTGRLALRAMRRNRRNLRQVRLQNDSGLRSSLPGELIGRRSWDRGRRRGCRR